MDFDLGGSAQNLSRSATGGQASQSAMLQDREATHVAFFEICVSENNEKADELAKDGSMMDGCEMAQLMVSTVQWKRERGSRGVATCTLDKKGEGKSIARNRAAASNCRCMRSGKRSKHMKNNREVCSPRHLEKDFIHKLKTWRKRIWKDTTLLGRDPNGETLVWYRKCSGFARCRLGPKRMNRCRKGDTNEYESC